MRQQRRERREEERVDEHDRARQIEDSAYRFGLACHGLEGNGAVGVGRRADRRRACSSYSDGLPKQSWMDVTTFRDGVRERLGEILVRKGRLSREQLDQAIEDAKASGDRLGTHLVNAKALHEEDIAIALADQFGLRYVVVDVQTLSPDLAAVMPERSARRLGVLPLSAAGDRVRLAIADPTDVVIIDELRMSLNGAFDLVVADPTTIRAGLDQVYPTQSPAQPSRRARGRDGRDRSATIDDRLRGGRRERARRRGGEPAASSLRSSSALRISTSFRGRTTFTSAPAWMG